MKKYSYYLMSMVLGLSITACGNDDNPLEEEPVTGDSEFFIPASIVDGKRVVSTAGDNGGINATYNQNGTIDKVIYNGLEYSFEYQPSRAAQSTGMCLRTIRSVNPDGSTYTAENFMFNPDGFLVQMTERTATTFEDGFENINMTYKFFYNDGSRISSISMKGEASWVDEDGPGANSGSGSIQFTYLGTNLQKMSLHGIDSDFECTYTYDRPFNNKYNIITPQWAFAISMGGESPIIYVLAQIGFLGNASTSLPSHMEFVATSDEPNDEPVIISGDIDYDFHPNGAVSSIKTDGFIVGLFGNHMTYTYTE